jgi:hypothetical protein
MDDPTTLIYSSQDARAEYFDEASRYRGLSLLVHVDPNGNETVYVERRLLPAPESMAVVGWYTVRDGDRLDLIASWQFDDARLWWRIADANRVLVPALACAPVGRRLALALPAGVPGPRTA